MLARPSAKSCTLNKNWRRGFIFLGKEKRVCGVVCVLCQPGFFTDKQSKDMACKEENFWSVSLMAMQTASACHLSPGRIFFQRVSGNNFCRVKF